MRRLLLLLLLTGIILSIAHAACVGVNICDETFNCGISDDFCPADVGCSCSDPDCGAPGGGAGGAGGVGVGALKIIYNCTQNAEYIRLPKATTISYAQKEFCVDLRWENFVANLNEQATFSIHQQTIGNETCYASFNLTYYNVTNGTLVFRVPRWWLHEFKIMPWTLNAGDVFVYDRNETEDYYYFKTKDIRTNYTVCGEYVDFWRILDAIDAYYKGKISFKYVIQMLVVYYG